MAEAVATTVVAQNLGRFEEFLSAKCKAAVEALAEDFPEKRSLEIDFPVFDAYDPELAYELFSNPYAVIKTAEEAVVQLKRVTPRGETVAPHVRFCSLPADRKFLIRNITSDHVNKFVGVSGVVTKIAKVQPKLRVAVFECRACGRIFKVAQTEQTGRLIEPGHCSCERRDFVLKPEESTLIDIQRAEIQEPIELLRGGEEAKKLVLWIEDDLTNRLIPGDKVEVCGVLRLLPPKFRSTIYDKYADCNSIQKIEKEFEEIELEEADKKAIRELADDPKVFEKIIKSIAPSIYGHEQIKEAIALQLFSGTPNKRKPDGMPMRSDLHILLIGDPGTSKTQLLRYVRNLAPKGLYISGKATTGVGLTVAAERDQQLAEGGWTLKAGALVLAAGGIALIDEFDKITDEDRSAMHEAMENQTISIAKAGMVATFKANTSILAAANPKYGRFDAYEAPAEQFDIPPTLLSRFDLIFPVRDVLDESRDRELADHILIAHFTAGVRAAQKVVKDIEEIERRVLPLIDPLLLKKYIAYARKNVKPVLTQQAMDKIKTFYTDLRRIGEKQRSIPITARYIDAMARLAEASAKVRLSPTVEIEDAERAIKLISFFLKEVGVDPETGRLDIDIIATGVSRSRMDKTKAVFRIVKTLSDKHGEARHETVLEQAKDQGIRPDELEEILGALRKNGDIYTPRYGVFKPAEEK